MINCIRFIVSAFALFWSFAVSAHTGESGLSAELEITDRPINGAEVVHRIQISDGRIAKCNIVQSTVEISDNSSMCKAAQSCAALKPATMSEFGICVASNGQLGGVDRTGNSDIKGNITKKQLSIVTPSISVETPVKPYMFQYQKCLENQQALLGGLTAENLRKVKATGLGNCNAQRGQLVADADRALQEAGWDDAAGRFRSVENTFAQTEQSWLFHVDAVLNHFWPSAQQENTENDNAPN